MTEKYNNLYNFTEIFFALSSACFIHSKVTYKPLNNKTEIQDHAREGQIN